MFNWLHRLFKWQISYLDDELIYWSINWVCDQLSIFHGFNDDRDLGLWCCDFILFLLFYCFVAWYFKKDIQKKFTEGEGALLNGLTNIPPSRIEALARHGGLTIHTHTDLVAVLLFFTCI